MTETATKKPAGSKPAETKPAEKRAAGLYAIIIGKLVKGAVLALVALSVFSLHDKDLPYEFRRFLIWIHEDPEKRFFTDLAEKVREITPQGMIQVAWGSLIYSALVTIEGVGLFFRQWWAGWLSIAESAFFVPIEVREMVRHFSWKVTTILLINVVIVVYLYRNRGRLFHRH